MRNRIFAFERRAYPRFKTALRVFVNDPTDALEQPYPAWIIDRSNGGICLEVENQEIEDGTVLDLQMASLPEDAAGIKVCVRNRRQADGFCRLGCEFVDDRDSFILSHYVACHLTWRLPL
ncbi:MAG: hypothetical protein KatS3mg105_3269 [Gemmatales bacterium]|nr:MAG: hypothetical protein KatS3mg105_3269 [Gemmatales bacterium]